MAENSSSCQAFSKKERHMSDTEHLHGAVDRAVEVLHKVHAAAIALYGERRERGDDLELLGPIAAMARATISAANELSGLLPWIEKKNNAADALALVEDADEETGAG
jgi:hypothetical protein